MANTKSTKLRDTSQTAAHYKKLAAYDMKAIDRAVQKQSIGLLATLPEKCLSIGLALYSAGHPPQESLHWFDQAVSHSIRLLEIDNYHLFAYTTLASDLELFPAAYLAGRGNEMIEAYRRCTFEKQAQPRVEGLIAQLCAVLNDEPLHQLLSTTEDLKRNAKEWLVLPPLFSAVASHAQPAFNDALINFLTGYWMKVVRANDDTYYVGDWCLLATALCSKMQVIPNLPDSAKKFVAEDLVYLG